MASNVLRISYERNGPLGQIYVLGISFYFTGAMYGTHSVLAPLRASHNSLPPQYLLEFS